MLTRFRNNDLLKIASEALIETSGNVFTVAKSRKTSLVEGSTLTFNELMNYLNSVKGERPTLVQMLNNSYSTYNFPNGDTEYDGCEPKLDITVNLIGEDSNIFNLMGIVTTAMKRNGHGALVLKFTSEMWGCENYQDALSTIRKWVHVQ